MRGILVGVGIAMGYGKANILVEMMKDMESDSGFEIALRANRKSARAAATALSAKTNIDTVSISRERR